MVVKFGDTGFKQTLKCQVYNTLLVYMYFYQLLVDKIQCLICPSTWILYFYRDKVLSLHHWGHSPSTLPPHLVCLFVCLFCFFIQQIDKVHNPENLLDTLQIQVCFVSLN